MAEEAEEAEEQKKVVEVCISLALAFALAFF